MRKHRISFRNASAASQCQIKPSTHAMTSHGSNHRLGRSLNPLHHALPLARKLQRLPTQQGSDLTEFGPGAKRPRAPGNHRAH